MTIVLTIMAGIVTIMFICLTPKKPPMSREVLDRIEASVGVGGLGRGPSDDAETLKTVGTLATPEGPPSSFLSRLVGASASAPPASKAWRGAAEVIHGDSAAAASEVIHGSSSDGDSASKAWRGAAEVIHGSSSDAT